VTYGVGSVWSQTSFIFVWTKLKADKHYRHFKFVVNKAINRAKNVKLGGMEVEEFFQQFNYDIIELTKMLKFLDEWRDLNDKNELIQTSRDRLTALRDLINQWLNPN
jgi:hypothetical protein